MVSGPQSKDFPGVYINPFNVTAAKQNQTELPLVQGAVAQAVEWAKQNNVEIKIHPLLTKYLKQQQTLISEAFNEPKSRDQFSPKLYQHQVQGIVHILGNSVYNRGFARVLIADDPRLGKSAQALVALEKLYVTGPVLILCPKALISQWVKYVEEWFPYATTTAVTGKNVTEKRDKFLRGVSQYQSSVTQVIITNWETIHSLPEMLKIKWAAFIGDEAHRLKNRQSKLFTAVRSLQVNHILLLSATFVENTPADYWAVLNILAPKLFTSYWRWVGHYVKTKQGYNSLELLGPQNTHIMKEQLQPYIIQRKATDIEDMPEKLYENFYTELEPEHQVFYNTCKFGAKGSANYESKLQSLIALRQAAIHPALISSDLWDQKPVSKLALLQELLCEHIPANEQVLVFSSFVTGCMIAAWCARDCGGSAYYAGANADDTIVTDFQNNKFRTLCATPQKSGVGLNLFNANWVIYLDLPWSTIDLRQSEERVRAMGKKQPVTIINLIAQGTIDEKIAAHMKNKLNNVRQSDVINDLIADYWG